MRARPLSITFYLFLMAGLGFPPRLQAAQQAQLRGRVQTREGQTYEGTIACGQDRLSVESSDGSTHGVDLDSLTRLVLNPLENETTPALAKGNGLLGFYYPGTNFQGSPIIRLDSSIHFDWGWNIHPLPGFRQDLFSIRWTGQLEVPRTDVYTLYLGSDDGGRFWLAGQGPFSMWWRQDYSETNFTMRLEQGKPYDLRVEYFDYFGTARVGLSWSSSSFQKTPIPREFLYPVSLVDQHRAEVQSGAGLLATYHLGSQFGEPSFSRLEPAIALDATVELSSGVAAARQAWERFRRAAQERSDSARDSWQAAEDAFRRAAKAQGAEIAPGIPASFFTIRWSGWLAPPSGGVYAFRLLADEGVRFWLDDELVIDRWEEIYPGEYHHHAKLEDRKPVSVRVETINTDGQAVAKLFWTPPDKEEESLKGAVLDPSMPLLSPRPNPAPNLQFGGVLLTKGTFVPVLPGSLDSTTLRLNGPVIDLEIPRPRVARIVFEPLTPDQQDRLPANRSGALLESGDFIEGEVLGFKEREARVDSVLFGRRSFRAPGQVSALVLQPAPLTGSIYRLSIGGLGDVMTSELKLTARGIVVPELMDHAFPLGEVTELNRLPPVDLGKDVSANDAGTAP